MTTLKKKTLYLNTSDIYKGDPNGVIQNHCNCTFPLSSADLTCNNNEKLSISLQKIIVPTRLSYLESTYNDIAIAFQTTEPTSNPSTPANNGSVLIYISEYQFQPPFVDGSGNVAVAIPFYLAQSAQDLINLINACLDKFQEGGINEATTILEVENSTGYLTVSGAYSISLDNSYIFKENGSALFNKTGKKIAEMLGINTVKSRSGVSGVGSTLPPPFTIIQPSNPNNIGNRTNFSTYPVYVSSQGLLVKSNYSLDSFSSIENGVANVLSNIPTTLKPINETIQAEVGVDGGGVLQEVTIKTQREGSIVHHNQNPDGSHKTVSSKVIQNLNLQIVGIDDVLRWCNTNITYCIEVRWLV